MLKNQNMLLFCECFKSTALKNKVIHIESLNSYAAFEADFSYSATLSNSKSMDFLTVMLSCRREL
tara:strand:+ start:588 stop:782 length:195 start_codon:yes stop_codon:yes gene_type:complete